MIEDDLKLLRAMNVDWGDDEFGAPAIDPKRPYGNGDVYRDIAEILGIELKYDVDGIVQWQLNHMRRLHIGTKTALQIVLATGQFSAGTYEADLYMRNWRKYETNSSNSNPR